MNPGAHNRGKAAWAYRMLLRLYPDAFRRRYEEEMVQVFEEDWTRACTGGAAAWWRYWCHIAWDIARTAPKEWAGRISNFSAMTIAAVVLGIVCISFEPAPLVLKIIGCALLTTTFGVVAVAASGRGRMAQLKIAALGLPIGLILAPFIGLNPKLAPPPENTRTPVSEPTLTGSAIYQRTCEVYSHARTYADKGEVQTVFTGGVGAHTQIRTFTTAFVRGGGFRFEFQEQFTPLGPWKKYVIWQDGTKTKRWWTVQPYVAVVKNLGFALSTAAGVSGTASIQIPEQLQPERIGPVVNVNPRERSISKLDLLGRQRVDGSETFKVQLTRKYGHAVTLWIDTQSFLIRRISSSMTLPSAVRVDETIVYQPQLNVPVDRASLTFQPDPDPVPFGWRIISESGAVAMGWAFALSCAARLVNFLHRRKFRKRWLGTRWLGRELWLAPLEKRAVAGYAGMIAVSIGLWLGGTNLDGVSRNSLLALFTFPGGFALYIVYRRSLRNARFSS